MMWHVNAYQRIIFSDLLHMRQWLLSCSLTVKEYVVLQPKQYWWHKTKWWMEFPVTSCEKCSFLYQGGNFATSTAVNCLLRWLDMLTDKANTFFFLFSLLKKQLPDTHAKFHVLFLFFVAALFFISILSLFCYHLWLVGKNRTTIGSYWTRISC